MGPDLATISIDPKRYSPFKCPTTTSPVDACGCWSARQCQTDPTPPQRECWPVKDPCGQLTPGCGSCSPQQCPGGITQCAGVAVVDYSQRCEAPRPSVKASSFNRCGTCPCVINPCAQKTQIEEDEKENRPKGRDYISECELPELGHRKSVIKCLDFIEQFACDAMNQCQRDVCCGTEKLDFPVYVKDVPLCPAMPTKAPCCCSVGAQHVCERRAPCARMRVEQALAVLRRNGEGPRCEATPTFKKKFPEQPPDKEGRIFGSTLPSRLEFGAWDENGNPVAVKIAKLPLNVDYCRMPVPECKFPESISQNLTFVNATSPAPHKTFDLQTKPSPKSHRKKSAHKLSKDARKKSKRKASARFLDEHAPIPSTSHEPDYPDLYPRSSDEDVQSPSEEDHSRPRFPCCGRSKNKNTI